MFYNNFCNDKKIKYKSLKYKMFKEINSDIDESLLTLDVSPMTYNFDFSDGSLKDGIGFHSLRFRCYEDDRDYFKELEPLPDSLFIKGCWLFKAWGNDINVYRSFFVVYSSSGEIFYNRLHNASTEFVKVPGLNFSTCPIAVSCRIDDEDTLIFISENEGMYSWKFPEIVKKITSAPNLSSVCVHDNRLYATTYGEKRSILYSDSLNPIDFAIENDNAGVINLIDEFGKCNKVISFKGYLYVFRDFNITKITNYLSRDSFSVSQIFVGNSKIYDKTVCVCGDNIYYLASDGIYKFDGSSSKFVSLKLSKLFKGIDNTYAVAEFCDGYYYLSCKLNFNDGEIVDGESSSGYCYNNALLKINVLTGEFSLLRGRDVIGIYSINDVFRSEVCALVRHANGNYRMGMLDNSGMYFEQVSTKVWRSPSTDGGIPEKDKLIKELIIETKNDLTIELSTENGVYKYFINGKNKIQRLKLNIKCKQFAFTFKSNSVDNHIKAPQILVGYYD